MNVRSLIKAYKNNALNKINSWKETASFPYKMKHLKMQSFKSYPRLNYTILKSLS